VALRRRFAGAFLAAFFVRRFAGRRLAVFFAAAFLRRFAGRRLAVFFAAAFLVRRFAGRRAVDLRAVVLLAVRRFAGLRAVFLAADFRAVRLFAGGTVTTFLLGLLDVDADDFSPAPTSRRT
jgi:hypothetical protein